MSKFGQWLKNTFLPNKETAAMWGLFAGGGLLTFAAGLMREHIDHARHEKKFDEEIKKQAQKLVEGFRKES